MNPALKPIAKVLAAALALAFCAVIVREAAFVPLNSDVVQNYLQTSDILHGNLLLKGWHLASDNFYLSDNPVFIVCRLLFGGRDPALYLPPAILYCATIVVAMLIVRRLAKDSLSLLIGLAAATFFLATPTLDGVAPLTLEGAQHGSTIALALTAWLAMDVARAEGWTAKSAAALAAFAAICFAIFFSDPLGAIIFLAPTLMVLGRDALYGSPPRKAGLLAVGALGMWALAKVAGLVMRLLGGFSVGNAFGLKFVTAAAIFQNVQGALFGLFHIDGAYVFGRDLSDPLTVVVALRAAGLALIAVALVRAIRRGLRGDEGSGLSLALALGVVMDLVSCVLSQTFTSALGSGGVLDGGAAARFLTPALIFGGLLAAIELPPMLAGIRNTKTRTLAIASCLVAAAAVTGSFLVQGAGLWSQKSWIARSDERATGQWLLRNGLTHGLGSYWASSIITVLAHEKVVVRPVEGLTGRLQPMRWLSGDRWYSPQVRPQFVIYRPGADVSAGFAVGHEAIAATYGPPKCIYAVQAFVIEVTDWRSPCDPRAGRLIVPGDLAALGAPQTAPPPAALSPAAAADSVRSLYAEVLGREPDAAGLAYWVKQLQAGMTRDQLKTAFSASREADRRAAASPSGSAAGQS